MIQEIRIYKQFDTDLIALCAAGYPVADMIRDAVTKFANGSPIRFNIGDAQYFDMNGKKNVRMRISISDKKAVEVLKNVKHGYRNSFCKCVIRNALARQNVAAFFADETLMLSLCRNNTSDLMVLPSTLLPQKSRLPPVVTSGADFPLPPAAESVSQQESDRTLLDDTDGNTSVLNDVDAALLLDVFDSL